MPSVSHSDRGHATYGASSASRWSQCPYSIPLLKSHPTEEGDAAKEGTKVHEFIERLFVTGKIPAEANEEQAKNAKAFVDYVMAIVDFMPEDYVLLFESAVAMQGHEDDMYGTADVIAYSEELGELHVFDYKNGVGVVVEAEDNLQGEFYASAACDTHDLWASVDKVTQHFYQPRCRRADAESTATYSIEDLSAKRQALIEDKEYAAAHSTEAKIGDHCMFCNKFKCNTYLNKNMGSLDVFDDLDVTKKPDTLDIEEEVLCKIVVNASKMKSFIDACVKLSLKSLEAGSPIEGLKLVDKKRTRSLGDPASVLAMSRRVGVKQHELAKPLEPLSYTALVKKFKSVVEDKKKLKKLLTDLDSLYTLESSGVTVAPQDDKRPEAKLAENEFDCVEEASEFDPFA